jgi:ribosomal protein L7/L12
MFGPISDDNLERIRAELAAGHKIEAIKLFRAASGAGLAEAKRAVEALEAGQPIGEQGIESASDDQIAKIQAAIFAGNKIQAIKLHRAATGLGLKESKDFVEALEAELRRTDPTRFTAPVGKGCGTTVLYLILALLLVAWSIIS